MEAEVAKTRRFRHPHHQDMSHSLGSPLLLMCCLGLWLLHSRSVLGNFSRYHLELESFSGVILPIIECKRVWGGGVRAFGGTPSI